MTQMVRKALALCLISKEKSAKQTSVFGKNRRVKFDKHTCEFLQTHASCSQEERFERGKLPFLSGLKRT